MYRSSPLVPLDSCLTAAACLSSACSFAVSQVSDLALQVGYVALVDFNFYYVLPCSVDEDMRTAIADNVINFSLVNIR